MKPRTLQKVCGGGGGGWWVVVVESDFSVNFKPSLTKLVTISLMGDEV